MDAISELIEIRPQRRIFIDYRHNPKSDTTLFLIHGMGGRGVQWRSQIDALSKLYSLVIPDLYGHGKSDKPSPNAHNPYSFLEFKTDLEIVFNEYANKHNVIIGHSYGGALAAALAFEFQDRVSALVLVAPLPCTSQNAIPFMFRLPTFMLEIIRPILDKQFEKMAFAKNTPRLLIEEEMLANHKNPMYVISCLVKGIKTIPAIDFRKLTIPVLMVFGEQDHIVPAKVGYGFYKILPKYQTQMVHDAAHMIQLEKPDKFNELLVEFLKHSA